ncbi:MAG: hypothetical protein AAF497_17965 [Planctomycetota bacterium]
MRKDRGGGIPWITILTPAGEEIATSDGPSGNVGCPVLPSEIAHFKTMISTSANELSTQEVDQLIASLDKFAEKYRRN